MGKVQRFHSNERLSEMAIYNGVIYLSGQVPETTLDAGAYEQTKEVLGLIDKLLAEVGSNKSRIINAQIYLADMDDYDAMNRAWDEWVDKNSPPTRATVEAKLASPDWKVEIVITAII
ncbi:endoribonuclease L-PSP family protein [Pasteurella multocida]|uniref:Endoribonuclease L-PSP n=1 Tax=Pasteurella dagmatis ATCC 43325 TaxID=667128 RepID=C9PPP8_9PAST|nr:RidA family protein [Pasteurella dagmatis]EEX50349.1 endoribonuclease L-PSP [Pasteurella dagmatis ATCC 43325]SNV56864.1 endoribonuclease L-PSP family protein [Pasteurella dagmatis]VEI58026.1 endoribonuclease L-PSP family protein [Pasteurella multocida]